MASVAVLTVQSAQLRMPRKHLYVIMMLYLSSSGQTHVEHVIAIGLGVTQEDCTERCCRLGPSNCQYLWIFDDKCFAVSCNANPDSCQPISLGRTSRPIMTTYIKMNFSVIHDDPPIANVGPGKVIQLPQSEVYLYGNYSSDDHVRTGPSPSLSLPPTLHSFNCPSFITLLHFLFSLSFPLHIIPIFSPPLLSPN